MNIYISGAITGTDDAEERFERWERILADAGYGSANPYCICRSIAHWCHEDIMTVCRAVLDVCDGILLTPGWEKSLGAQQEYGYALASDKLILKPEDVMFETKLRGRE